MKRILLVIFAALALLAGPALSQVTIDATKTRSAAPFAGTFTWAGRPTCDAALSGSRARISDVGVSPGIVVVCDGTRWVLDGVQVLYRSNIPLSHTGDLVETTKASVTIPGGLLGINGALEITGVGSAGANNANAKTLRARLGGIGGTAYVGVSVASALSYMLSAPTTIANRNSASSQVGGPAGSAITGGNSSAITTSSVDTSVDTTLVFTIQLGNASDTSSWEMIVVKGRP